MVFNWFRKKKEVPLEKEDQGHLEQSEQSSEIPGGPRTTDDGPQTTDDGPQTMDHGLSSIVSGTSSQSPEQEEKKTKPGFFQRLKSGLNKTSKALAGRVDRLVLGKKEISDDLFEELEEILITSDIGVNTTNQLIANVQDKVARKVLNDPAHLKHALAEEMLQILQPSSVDTHIMTHKPHIVMVIGVNGVGKTTTIGKLAARYMSQGKKTLLVAGDTFRAAAIEQLEVWAARVGVDVVRQKTGSDPSAVVYDGIESALARNVDIVIIDTAGRLHTKVNLMSELQKIHRVIGQRCQGAPHEVLLVLDATTGQNALSQAKAFYESLQVTGIALTKLDGSAKGGIAVAILNELKIPIQYVGVGEQVSDLQDFEPKSFVDAMFADNNSTPSDV
ncbi:MAG: signal recognition particle-docking protein FtsY [Pseudomonadota bacterium]